MKSVKKRISTSIWQNLKLEDVIILTGIVGVYGSFQLVVEKFHLLENPGTTLSCDLNPIIACGSVITTDQASAFGFPNPIAGVAGFAGIITIGMAIKAGAKFAPWFWQGLQIGVLFGIGFTHWLMYQSIFNIGKLCPYCMVVWTAMIPLFVYVTRYTISNKIITNPLGEGKWPLKAFETVLLWYVAVIVLILVKFWYYWQTIAPFNWFV